jgi:hypothetical protein
VGNKTVLLAQSVETDGTKKQIQRNRRQITGKVVSAHKVQVQGLQNQCAIIDVSAGSGGQTGQQAQQAESQFVDLPAARARA